MGDDNPNRDVSALIECLAQEPWLRSNTGVEIVATTWRKYGHDRTYLAGPDGIRVGWVDNRTGELTVELEGSRLAVIEWCAANLPSVQFSPVGASSTPDVSDSVGDVAGPPAGHDLAEQRPGHAARQQAGARLSEMREESRFKTFVARVFDVKTEERAWRLGAAGETTVGERLEKLTTHGWHILHAVPIGDRGADIDHLLIGPGGVWTINTKNHPGKTIWVGGNTVMVNGQRVPYIRNSIFEADRVRALLGERLQWEPFVKAALVVLTGSLVPNLTIRQMPEKVVVLDRMDIPTAFKKSPNRLSREQVAEIYEIARRTSTWS